MWSRVEILKFCSVIIGIVDVGLTSYAYIIRRYHEEEFFLAIIIIALLISLSMFVFTAFGLLDMSELHWWKVMDIFYHGLVAIFIFIGAILMATSVDIYKNKGWSHIYYEAEHKYYERICASLFGFVNVVVYACISVDLYLHLPHVTDK